ncbi:PAS domain-containing protein, partial [Vibrio splendidus]
MHGSNESENQSHLDSVEQQVERYKQVLDVMPAGVILLDTHGEVREANPEAHRILGVELVGEKWFSVIQSAFDPKDDDG